VVPDDELLTDAVTIRDRALLATLLVMLGAVPLTYLAARLVSKPIRELADEAAAIRRFDFAADVKPARWCARWTTSPPTWPR
jgi:hypothetical protein